MKQPDLGLKVAELRQQKKISQELLAEACEVSTRTIQRIESGEVDPRTHTLTMLSTALEFDFGQNNTQNENLWLTLLHLSSIFCIPVISLLIWSWKKSQSYKIDKQGRQVLNFQITMTLTLFAALFLLMLVPAGLMIMRETGVNMTEESRSTFILFSTLCVPVPLILACLFCAFQGIINAMRAQADQPIHYPLSIPFLK